MKNFILQCTVQKDSSFHFFLVVSHGRWMSDQISKWKVFFFIKPIAEINLGSVEILTFSHCHWCPLFCVQCVYTVICAHRIGIIFEDLQPVLKRSPFMVARLQILIIWEAIVFIVESK